MIVTVNDYNILIDDEDLIIFNSRHWNVQKHEASEGRYYFQSCERSGGVKIDHLLHRDIAGCVKNDGKIVDHMDGNTLNCQKNNLRVCDNFGNTKNAKMRKDNTVGLKGVTYDRHTSKYRAQIQSNKKKISIGSFASKEDAYKAYCKKALELHGEYARLS